MIWNDLVLLGYWASGSLDLSGMLWLFCNVLDSY